MNDSKRFGMSQARSDLGCGDCRRIIATGSPFYFDNDRKGPKGFGKMICAFCKEQIESGTEPTPAASGGNGSSTHQYSEKLGARLDRHEALITELTANVLALQTLVGKSTGPIPTATIPMVAFANKAPSPAAAVFAGKAVQPESEYALAEDEIPF